MAKKKTGLNIKLPANSRIKVIGLGGVGCALVPYLAMFLKSLQAAYRLVLIDGDQFEEKNTHRMLFQKLGNKAEVKAAEIATSLGSCDVSVVPVDQYILVENIEKLIREKDYVFLCVDNHPTRKLVSDHCSKLKNVVLISGGNEGIEPPKEKGTYGNVQIYLRKGGKDGTAALTRFHPEIANPQGKLPTEASCAELSLSVPQILFTNLAVASAMLNAFFAYIAGKLTYQEAKFDILEARMLPQFPIENSNGKGK